MNTKRAMRPGRPNLSENIFGKQVRLIAALQESCFAGEDYQALRAELVHTCFQQIQNLNPELIEVKLRRQYIEKYKKKMRFVLSRRKTKPI